MKHKRRNFSLFFDRSFSKGFGKQIIWLFIMMLAVYLFLIVLSYSGIFYNSEGQESYGRWYDVLFFLIDPGNPTDSLYAPFALIIAFVGMVIFSGMLISVISNILSRRVENYQQGETSYNVSDHVIILGFNRSVPSLLKKIHTDYPKSHILLMCEKDSAEIRDWLHANIDNKFESNLIVMNGDIKAEDDITRLFKGGNPLQIYVLGEEDRENHDDISLECVRKVSSIYNEKFHKPKKNKNKIEPKIPCYVQINSDSMYSLLQQVDFCKDLKDKDSKKKEIKNLIFHPFNFNEIWSQKVLGLTSFDGEGFKPLDGNGIGIDSTKSVHLIIVGMTGLGKSLAVNAAQVCHFPNFKEGEYSTYTRITFIDPGADELGNRFRNRHSVLFDLARWKDWERWHDPLVDEDSTSPYKYLGPKNFMDIEWEFIKGDIADPEIRKYLKDSCSKENRIVTVALCGEDSERNLAITMSLPSEFLNSPSLNTVLVRQKESDIAIKLMREIPNRGEKLKAFGMLSECYSENLLNDEFGKLIDYLYNTSNGWTPDWENNNILNKWSSNYSANMLFIKLRSLGFNEDEFSKDPITLYNFKFEEEYIKDIIQKVEHNRWVTERITLGFRPLKEEEQEQFENIRKKSKDYNEIKTEFKSLSNVFKSNKIHIDICSNVDLNKYDPNPGVKDYDIQINSKLGELYLKIKELNKFTN